MTRPGRKALRRSATWLKTQFVDAALILGYHRVVDSETDPFNISVSPKFFEEHLDVITRLTLPVRLPELVQDLELGTIRRRSIVVTFDDGYADFLHEVKPRLEHAGVPATLFVTSGALGRRFWWEELRHLVLAPERLPHHLSLRLNGGTFEWVAVGDDGSPRPKDGRNDLLSDLYLRLLPLPDPERSSVLTELQVKIGTVPEEQAARPLTPDELVELAASGLVEVGAHSVTHPMLAAVPESAQRWEISESKRQLEELSGQPVQSFSYPNGSWSPAVGRVVADGGYSSACGSRFDVVWSRSNRYHLPRFWVSNRDGEWLARQLHNWLRA